MNILLLFKCRYIFSPFEWTFAIRVGLIVPGGSNRSLINSNYFYNSFYAARCEFRKKHRSADLVRIYES